MKELHKKYCLSLIFLTILLIILLSVYKVSAQSLFISPSTQNVSLYSKSYVTVNVSVNASNLFAYQYDILYNQTIFNINQSGIVEGPHLKTGGVQTLCITPNISVSGIIKNIACTRTGPTSVSGSGNLTTLTLRLNLSTAPGTTQIRIVNSKLSNINSQPIGHTISNATVNLYGCLNGEQRACGSDIGECIAGNQTCNISNQWGSCTGGVGPNPEICDGKDNDCNGYIDENLTGCSTAISVTTDYYDGSTTNFSSLNLSNSITGMVLEKMIYGKIMFRESVLFTQSVNLDYNTNISFNRAFINSTVFPMLNKSATIYLYSLAFVSPVIQRDGSPCPSSICTFVSYSGGTLIFNVTQFSEYSAAEGGSTCGANGCETSLGETCSSCPQDCGQCPCPSGQTRCSDGVCRTDCGGGGGDGGGGGAVCSSGQTRNCSVAHKGKCAAGTENCVNGNWAGCPAPSSEICNKEDDNCDGQIDEGLNCQCYIGETRPCGSNVGECREGTTYCTSAGSWGECTGETKPSAEVCNGKDDNCDGTADENCVPETNITACQDGLIPETGCMCGDKFYTIGYCSGGIYFEEPPPEFPWITITIFGVMIILILIIIIIYKEFYKKGKKEITWDDLLKKYKAYAYPQRLAQLHDIYKEKINY